MENEKELLKYAKFQCLVIPKELIGHYAKTPECLIPKPPAPSYLSTLCGNNKDSQKEQLYWNSEVLYENKKPSCTNYDAIVERLQMVWLLGSGAV